MNKNDYRNGLMQYADLNIIQIIKYAADVWPDKEIITQTIEGDIHSYTYRQSFKQIAKCAHALIKLGVKPGDNVGIIGWNTFRQFELYYAIGSIGAVCHTINPRLGPHNCLYVINHAKDKFLFFDTTFEPLVSAMKAKAQSVKQYVSFGNEEKDGFLNYDKLLEVENDTYDWPLIPENSACGLCYTSGTTGNPKGVEYTHRSIILHSLTTALPSLFGLDDNSIILPVVPMFHVNAWNCPYVLPLIGAKIVFPGARLDGSGLYALLEEFKVSHTIGVPSVWMGLLQFVEETKQKFNYLRDVLSGGSALPERLVREFNSYDITIRQGWGMTELSPVGTINRLRKEDSSLNDKDLMKKILKQGYRVPFIDMRIVDNEGNILPNDGEVVGKLQVRGPWVVSGYYQHKENILTDDGWFDTGDIGNLDDNMMLQITDRIKDVIKSGGEWISTQEIENITMTFDGIEFAAVIAAFHPKWQERPLLIVSLKAGSKLDKVKLMEFLTIKLAKISLPDAIEVIGIMPLGATGKVLKTVLREKYKDYKLIIKQ